MPSSNVTAVINTHAPDLLAVDGVEGLYGSTSESGEPCIKIAVREYTESLKKRIPKQLGGYPVVIVETGRIAPMGEDQE